MGQFPSEGVRLPGAGRKNEFLHVWKIVKAWHTVQRLEGLQIDTDDMWMKFRDVCETDIQIYKDIQVQKKLIASQEVWLQTLEVRISKLDLSEDYRKVYLSRLMDWGEMKIGAPSRRSPMTLEQEKLG